MKLTATQLRKIISEEVNNITSGKKNLSEAMSRITEDEVAAWKKGDWGYVSGDEAPEPGHDHQEFLHGAAEGHPMDDEGYMVKSRMASMKKMPADVCGLLDSEDQLPGWVQDLVATSHNDLQHIHDYLMGDEEMRASSKIPAQVAPMGESRRLRAKKLNEAHTRVTQDEMSAWMRGDWGFSSKDQDDSQD